MAKKSLTKNLDMTQGEALPLLTAFALPMLASNLLNQVYSITDSIIVGRYLGQTALAAVGVCMPIILLTASMIIGLNIGVGILMSQCFGQHDIPRMRHTFANSLYLGAALSLLAAAFGIPFSEPILRLMGTPAGPLAQAASYMRINFATTFCPVFYFLFSNAFRGMGDAYTALYCLIVSVISNVALDVLFVAVLGMGVAGSAWATALAQALSVVFAVIMLYRKYPEMHITRDDLRLDGPLLGRITALAVPLALQSGFNNFGNVLVQSCINGFGEAIMAAYTAASRLGTLSLMPVETAASALSVYAGQNYGARKLDRIRDGVRATHIINLVLSTVLGAALLLFGRPLTLLFLSDASEEVLSAASRYLLFAAVPGILYGVMHVYQQVLRGVGRANQSVVGGFVQLGAKVVVAMLGAWVIKDLSIVWLAWPISYVAGTIYPYIDYRRNFEQADSANL